MYVIYCDGSIKKTNTVVVGIIVAHLSSLYPERVEKLVYLHKNVFKTSYKENLHELLSCLEAIKVAALLNIHNEKILIVNDSVADVIIMNGFKKGTVCIHEKVANKDVKKLLDEVNHIALDNIEFKYLPRTTLGINVADFLNKDVDHWINQKERPFLQIQINKMINRPFDYNISSKHKHNNTTNNPVNLSETK